MLNFFIKLPILKRLIPSIYKKYIFFTKNYFKEVKVNEVYYNLDLRHLIDRRFYFHKEYEEELFIPLVNTIRNNNIDIFFDIGSCWGIYSLRLSKIFPNLQINSFEPIDQNIKRLNNSIKKNNISNIKIYNIALGSHVGNVELGAIESYSPNFKINENKSVIIQKSEINFLDNIFIIKNKYLAFKIDTEGFELEVLKGAKNLITNNKCYLQIEINPNDIKNKEVVVNYLSELNYKIISINKFNKTDYIFSNFELQNILL